MQRSDDEMIIRFLDGDLTDEEAADFARVIAADAALRARVEALSPDLDTLREQLDNLLADAPAMQVPDVPPRRSLWQYAAAASVVFALGFGAGALVKPGFGVADWHRAVADYQVLYTTETLTSMPMAPELRMTGLERTAATLGRVLPFEAVQIEGLEFMRAQILGYQGAPLAQLVYLDPAGRPIAFCITRRDGEDNAGRSTQIAGLNARVWRGGGYGFILIGETETSRLSGYEQQLRGKLGV